MRLARSGCRRVELARWCLTNKAVHEPVVHCVKIVLRRLRCEKVVGYRPGDGVGAVAMLARPAHDATDAVVAVGRKSVRVCAPRFFLMLAQVRREDVGSCEGATALGAMAHAVRVMIDRVSTQMVCMHGESESGSREIRLVGSERGGPHPDAQMTCCTLDGCTGAVHQAQMGVASGPWRAVREQEGDSVPGAEECGVEASRSQARVPPHAQWR